MEDTGGGGERPSFRKPAHDPSHRNYRRRSPTLSKSPPSPQRPSLSIAPDNRPQSLDGGGKRNRSTSLSPVCETAGGAGRVDQVKKVRNSGSERNDLKERNYRSGRGDHSPVSERTFQPPHHTHHHGRNHKVDYNDHQGDANAYAGSRHETYRREPESDRSDWNDRPREDRGHRDRDRDVERGRDRGKGFDKDDDRGRGGERGGGRNGSRGNMEGGGHTQSRVRTTEWDRERDRDRRGPRDRDRGYNQVSDGGELRYKEKETHEHRYRDNNKDGDRHKASGNSRGDRLKDEEAARVTESRNERDKSKDQSSQRDRDKDRLRPREDKNGRCVSQEVGKLNCLPGFEEDESDRVSDEAGVHPSAPQGDRGRSEDEGEKDRGRDKGKRHKTVVSRDERERGTTGWDQVVVPGMSGPSGKSSKEITGVSSVIVSDVSGIGGIDKSGGSEVRDHANVAGQLPSSEGKSDVDMEGKVAIDLSSGAQQPEVHDSGLNPGGVEGSKSATVAGGKPAKSSKWGPAPSTEGSMTEEVANDLNAAKMAAIRAAELVNKNLSLAGFMTADHKKKLLWGSKKAEVEQEPVVAAAGTNRWDTVHFSDRDRREKFHKLMGVKGDIKEGEAPPPPTGAAVFTEEKQRELQEDLEKQFSQGLRRRDGRTVGLGL